MSKLWFMAVACLLFFAGWYIVDLVEDRKKSVRILSRKPLLEDSGSMSELPIGHVEPNEKLKVLRIRRANDHTSIQVERADGSDGWIIYDNAVELTP